MFLRIKRYLMAEEGQGGASGNPAATTAPAQAEANVPQANGETVTMSRADLDAAIASAAKTAAEQAAQAARNSAYAEARRTFTGKGSKTKDEPSQDPSAPQPLDASEERRILRDFDRHAAKRGLADKLSPTQWQRAEKALLAERPDDVSSWFDDYFTGFGGSPAAAPAAQPTTTQPAPKPEPIAQHPVSNRGAPQATQTPIDELDLPTASDADRQAFIKQHGPRAYWQKLQKQLKGRQVVIAKR